jgi:hypothetical protein
MSKGNRHSRILVDPELDKEQPTEERVHREHGEGVSVFLL